MDDFVMCRLAKAHEFIKNGPNAISQKVVLYGQCVDDKPNAKHLVQKRVYNRMSSLVDNFALSSEPSWAYQNNELGQHQGFTFCSTFAEM